MQAYELIRTQPYFGGITSDALINCIEECYACARACAVCANACLVEESVHLTHSVRLNLDCAEVCSTMASVATRQTGPTELVVRRMLDACAAACRLCGDECGRHAQIHEHCHVCAEACRRCEQACLEARRSMAELS
jgi:hypothetical protein